MTFGGENLYPTVVDKSAALSFSIIHNHPFVDGNKRVAHAAMEVFLVLNGFQIRTSADEQEQIMLGLASGNLSREQLVTWLHDHIVRAKY